MKKIKLNLLLMLLSIFGFSQMALAVNESEPNNAWNQADVITLGATGTGACTATGDEDWWRVTSTVDGQLTVNFTSTNGIYLNCQVFDTLGTVYLNGTFTNGSNVVNFDGLAAGTYYIRLYAYNANESPSYSFVPTWTTPAQTIDVEPNDVRNQAKVLPLNGSVTGHVGYYYYNKRDTMDWWKVTTNKDGHLYYTLTSNNGQYIYAQLFDNDGVTYLSGSYTNGTSTFNYDGLAVGTYYIRIFGYNTNGFSPYNLSDSLGLPPNIIDVEPNGTAAQALNINVGDSTVGHVGYYYNHYRDTLDWYKVTTTLDGQLNYSMTSNNGQYVYLQLFDNDGVTYLSGGGYTNGTATFTTNGLAAGTYYLRINAYDQNGFIPYKIKVTQTLPPVTIDVEPNGTKSSAKTINPNDSITGHISYYYNHGRDTIDFRKVTINSNGKLEWTISSLNGYYLYAQLFDNDAVTYIAGNYTNGTTTFSADGLAPGTYYLRVVAYDINSQVPYYLKTKFTPAGNDPEPNGTYTTAKAINLNDSLSGTISYYYNHVRDTTDWFALTTTNDGQLNVKLYSLNGEYIYLTVYDKNGTTVLYNNYSSAVVNYSRNDLAKGTYYVRVVAYSINNFLPYALVNNLVNNNANDPEPNNYAKNAYKINGYTTRTGNTNYYYNGANDVADWWKLGYYNLAPLNITITKVQHTFDANYPDILYRLYKDTNAAALDSVELIGNATLSYNHNYTGLATGTYYVRITPLNNSFGGYSVRANYKDTTSQTVTRLSDVADTVCGKGALTYYITRGKPPYSVQLYKDGVASGSGVNTSDTAKFTLLDAGYYSITTRSTTAATYTVASTDTTIVPKTVGLKTAQVTTSSAILKWTGLACVDGYKLQWKLKTGTTWTTIFQPAGATQDTIDALTASTQYQFRVYSYVLYNSVKYYGLVSATKTFTTPAVRLANDVVTDISTSELEVFPNPATDKISFNVDDVSSIKLITITNTIGQQVAVINDVVDLNQSVDVSSLQQGIYFITIKTSTNIYTSRFVKE
ncbi:MAG: T9SS type A sorting domain-containing protein [Bacteroidia bacterium]